MDQSKQRKGSRREPREGSDDNIREMAELHRRMKSGKGTKSDADKMHKMAKTFADKALSKASNDIAFYNKYPDLIRDAANIIFNEIAGTKFNAPVKATTNTVSWPAVGIKIKILPTIGKCFEPNHPFNYQMRDLWLALHRAYRGIGTYEYADLGIVLYSIMMVFADIARAERVYGLASKFVAQNRSYPNSIISALGLDPALVSASELADFRYQLNRCIAKARVLCLPKGFSAFELYIRLFGNVFKDSDNVRSQWFFYDSDFFCTYAANFTTGGAVKYVPRTKVPTIYTFASIIGDLNTQLDALLSDTDVARMCSDILKAYGENGVQTLVPVPENFEIDPVKDDIRTLQLHNTTFVGSVAGGGFSSTVLTGIGTLTNAHQSWLIYQDGGVVNQHLFGYDVTTNPDPSLTSSNYFTNSDGKSYPAASSAVVNRLIDGDVQLNTYEDSPSQDAIVEMTRQTVGFTMSTVTSGGNTYSLCELDNYGIYLCVGFAMYTGDSSTGYLYGSAHYSLPLWTFDSAATAEVAIANVSMLSRLDWFSQIRVLKTNSSGVPTADYEFWDQDNYSLISKVSLSRIHDACNLSLFRLELAPKQE